MDTAPLVCLLCADLEHGGGAHQLLELCRYLDRDRYALRVVSLAPRGPVADELLTLDVPVYPLNLERTDTKPGRFSSALAFSAIYMLLRRMRPHILQTFDHRTHTVGRLAGRFVGVPWILSTVRNACAGSSWRSFWARATSGLSDLFLVSDGAMEREASERYGAHPKRIRRIPQGINLLRVTARAPSVGEGGGGKVVSLSGLSRDEGTDTLIDALSILFRYHEELRATLLGTGPDPVPFIRRAQRLGLQSRIAFPGVQPEVAPALAASSVCVVARRTRGISMALLEGLGSGRPVVATAIAGVDEFLEDGVHALLVPPDQPALLADAVDRLLFDRELAGRIGRAGKELVEREGLARDMASRHEELYAALA